MMYDQNMRGITNSQTKWMDYGLQMSTGQRVNKPSDDPIAASQAVVVSQAQQQNEQYKTAYFRYPESIAGRKCVVAGDHCCNCGTYLTGCGCERYTERR